MVETQEAEAVGIEEAAETAGVKTDTSTVPEGAVMGLPERKEEARDDVERER